MSQTLIKQIRKSGHGDYLAVDIIDERGKIIHTPLYLRKNIPHVVLGKDTEQGAWFWTQLIWDGKIIKCKDVDERSLCMDLEFEATEKDLLDEYQFKFPPQ